MKDALDLIRRQSATIERLESELQKARAGKTAQREIGLIRKAVESNGPVTFGDGDTGSPRAVKKSGTLSDAVGEALKGRKVELR